MTARDALRRATELALQAKGGKRTKLDLLPPSTSAEITSLESRLPCPLPEDIRELLLYCRGSSCEALDFVDFIDFTGADCMFEYADAFPHGLPFAADGCGNFWVVDLWPDSRTWGPIYFACHDAPVILYQSASLQDFVEELMKALMPPFKSAVEDVCRDDLYNVWGTNPGVMSHEECIQSGDPELIAFATERGPKFQFIDLRNAKVGHGFSWGRYGAETTVRRWGRLPVFGYEKPERRGLWARVFG
jgi:hypothetical protein